MTMFRIEMLPARQGDALWVEYGDSAHPRRALIDAGTPETWDAVRPRIEQLPAGERRFELLIISHIDLDHIGGVLPLLESAKDLGIKFDDVWFNGFRHLPKTVEPMGPVEGEKLTNLLVDGGYNWNGAFDEKAVVVPTGKAPPEKTLDGGLKLTLLSPRPEELDKLRPVWEPLVKEHGLDPKTPAAVPPEPPPGLEHLGAQSVDQLADVPFKADSAEANGSSIVVLAEFEGKRALLCADGFPEVILGCVERLLGDAPADARLDVDAFKLPHHGSRRNINLGLLERVRSPLHLFSSDGTKTKHPNPEAVARAIVTQDRPELRFNYRTKFNEMWDPQSPEVPPANGRKWKAEFPADGATGARVDLAD
jgi:beta-lactamase superfamily II metal-dependent hydrolase